MRSACPNPNKEGCPWSARKGGCFADLHHQVWPKSHYRTPLEKRYRELPENKEQLCRFLHDQVHFEPIPEKPSIQEMRSAIAGIALEGYDDNEAA